MTQEQSTGNKLIAEFMGASDLTKVQGTGEKARGRYGKPIRGEERKALVPYIPAYHSSWNLLMPVVEKIERMKSVSVIIQNEYCEVKPGLFRPLFTIQVFAEKKIDAVYDAVVEFITWYNQQIKTNEHRTG